MEWCLDSGVVRLGMTHIVRRVMMHHVSVRMLLRGLLPRHRAWLLIRSRFIHELGHAHLLELNESQVHFVRHCRVNHSQKVVGGCRLLDQAIDIEGQVVVQ